MHTLSITPQHVHMRITELVKQHPHAAKMRKRKRTLRPIRPSHRNELWYKAELLKIVKLLRASAERHLKPFTEATDWIGDARLDVRGAVSQMAADFGGIESVAQRLSALAVQRNLEDVDARLIAAIRDSVSVDVTGLMTSDGPIRDAIREATEANVALITSIPAQFFDRIQEEVSAHLDGSERFDSLEDAILHIGNVTESRAKLIARDQTSKLNSSFNEARQTSVGIEGYIWQTAGDERVRETHAANDGKYFAWSDPPEETGNPGDDINCRCVAIPYFDLDAMENAVDEGGDDASTDPTEEDVAEAE